MAGGSLPRRLSTTVQIGAELARDRRTSYLPRASIEARRDARVRSIVRYASETVPYYRELFRGLGIDPREIRTADDLTLLPALTKADLQRDPLRFRSESREGRTGLEFATSGSTGRPLPVFHDRRSLLLDAAWSERSRTVEGHFCGRRSRYLRVGVGHPRERARRHYLRASSIRPPGLRPRWRRISIEIPIEAAIAQINELRPDVVSGYGAHLELLFRTAAETGMRMHRPAVVTYGRDMMTPAGRDLIEQRFGVPVLQSYCTTEVLRVGHFCELRRGFHVNDDLCHIVLVDGDGVPVADGERGEVVISNLVNRGTVVLNYRLGDVARLDPSPCPCGRTLRLLTDLEGRVDDVVRLADGGHVHPLSISRELRDAPGLLRWQLVQFGDDRFELRLMTADDDAFARLSGDLTRRLSRVLRGADVAAIRHATLPAGRGGKFRAVVAARPRPPGAEATPFVHGAVRDVAGRAT